MTLRQVFYLAVSAKLVDKTEAAYDCLGRYLVQMRKSGELPWEWMADHTRWMRKPRTFSSLEEALRHAVRTYRRSLWNDQDVYVEVWVEKDTVAGVLLDVTQEWDVPLMAAKGFSSASFLHEAAQTIKGVNKPAFLYYFGDHDPSGVHIDRSIESDLREMAPKAEIHFERVAVLPSQIQSMGLPTRPTKTSDSRAKTFKGESVEVEAISAHQLRALARQRIEQHVDQHRLDVLRVAERSERESLTTIYRAMQTQRREEDA